jgi:hypothetical protein
MYPLVPHPHKLLDRIENSSRNSESVSTVSEQCSSFMELGSGEILSELLGCRYILASGHGIIIPWNKKQLKIDHIFHARHPQA